MKRPGGRLSPYLRGKAARESSEPLFKGANVCVSIRVCVCVQSVCVFVCNPCVCLARGAKSTVFYGVWGARGAPKTQQSEMLREPHSNKNRCSLQVCVCFRPCFKGENDNR